MKNLDRAYAELTDRVMEVLERTDLNEYMPEARKVIANAAAEIVSEIVTMGVLAFDGEVRRISLAVAPYQLRAECDENKSVWVVTATPDSEGGCRWCGGVFGSGDPGGRYRLCGPCYDSGPRRVNWESV